MTLKNQLGWTKKVDKEPKQLNMSYTTMYKTVSIANSCQKANAWMRPKQLLAKQCVKLLGLRQPDAKGLI